MAPTITTTWMGLPLRSPVVAASSGITDSVARLAELEAAGVGAVILKSLFEEEIIAEVAETRTALERPGLVFPEIADMEDLIDEKRGMTAYLGLIREARETLSVPVIASINCTTARTWPHYARMVEEAGAQALELNVFLMPTKGLGSDDDALPDGTALGAFERRYLEIVDAVREHVSIPVALKVSYHFTMLGRTLAAFSRSGISSLTLFNRFFNPDFDIDNFRIVPTNVLSTPDMLSLSLRWIAIMQGHVGCDLAASTGVHDGDALIKQILAGAQVVQIASILYTEGPAAVTRINERLASWMTQHSFESLDAFRGLMGRANVDDPAAFDRAQFLREYRSYRQ